MIWLILSAIALIVIGLPMSWFAWGWPGSDDGALFFFIIGGLMVVGGLVMLGVAAGTEASVHYADDRCERVGVQTERDVRFVRYTSFSWDCLTPSSDGWVSIDKVIKTEGDS